MPKSKKPTTKPSNWYLQLDQDDVDAALDAARDEATTDAYDLYEQHTGLVQAISDEMQFPWLASVLGETVSVVNIEMPDNNGLGLDLVVERNGKQYRVDAGSVDGLDPLPKGHLYFAAYLCWKKSL